MANLPAKLPILKIEATGNDFLLIDLISQKGSPLRDSRAELAKLLCNRHFGVGADGLVIVEEDDSGADFKWDFYNCDGSMAEMCGNAARGVSLYMSSVLNKSALFFTTRVGMVQTQVHSPDDIEVRMPEIKEAKWNLEVKFKGDNLSGDFVRAGVPHLVIKISDITRTDYLRELALSARAPYGKEGTNVTYVQLLSPARFKSCTFERGVDDFTLSCGTGAVAAAHSLLKGEENKTVEVEVPGGRLNVVWKEGRPHLRGPARIVAEIKVK